jgi:hypothetical protein
MTKGQEIAKQIWAVPVTQLTEPDAAAVIDAAIAEAVSKRTVECADLCLTTRALTVYDIRNSVKDAILALNAPPAPAYPFEKPCRCWEYSVPDAQAVSQSNWRRLLATHSTYVYLCPDASYCEVCGAARKGS